MFSLPLTAFRLNVFSTLLTFAGNFKYLTIALLVAVIGYQYTLLLSKDNEVLELKNQVIVYEVNQRTLKANLETVEGALDTTKSEYENYKQLHQFADAEVVKLRVANREFVSQTKAFENKLNDLRGELSVAELKLLDCEVPNLVVDAYNDERLQYTNSKTQN
ncbi:hypothetical protein ACN2LU_004427 [Vibrio vulnificus]|nr:hypothetical protein [Vibrio vulnificus]EHZ2756208.1 hypothetical protein [Vibrio vulnificus]EHZ2765431.1 hypothetical protein [Vibrio vulnificus]EKD9323319.1 hypothetical protein [Vibrio vulnificus]EME0154518.1 hypothetical protein [Vibrio vulnificus]